MKCGTKIVKYLLFFINLLVFLAGGTLLGIGIYIAVAGDPFKTVASAAVFNSVYITIAVGGALFIVGFFGCCGAIRESRCCLGTFFALVLILFLLQIAGAVLAIVMKDEGNDKAYKSLNKYSKDKTVRESWDDLQSLFKCCGMDGARDWKNVSVPASCCEDKVKRCNILNSYDIGCKDRISSFFWIIIGLCFGILLIELLAMIFCCCLYHAIGGGSEYSS